MIYLKTFKLSDSRITNNNIYPFNVLQNKEPDIFIFDNITVLYGNNGSGKSTILNIIAHKLNLKGKERNNPTGKVKEKNKHIKMAIFIEQHMFGL